MSGLLNSKADGGGMKWWGWVGFGLVFFMVGLTCAFGLTWERNDVRQLGVMLNVLSLAWMLWWSAWQ